MRYFIAIRAIYLMAYYFVLGTRPSRSYALSVAMACTSGTFLAFFIMLLVIFGSKDTKTRFPFEAILFHGLSYEEWRTAKVVKQKMDKVQTITNDEQSLPEDLCLIFLLILSFSGIVEYRPQTPEEMSDEIIGRFPRAGEVLTSFTVYPSSDKLKVVEGMTMVGDKQAEILASIKRSHTAELRDRFYQGATLSRLVYDGVRIVFRRKKLGPKRPAKSSAFMKAFGVSTNT